jgi:hypothetical protein
MPTPTHELQPTSFSSDFPLPSTEAKDRYVVIGCNKGHVIVLDLGESDHEKLYARY